MGVEIETAKIKGIRTVTKPDEEGVVHHRTVVALEFEGLDIPTLDRLGKALHLQVPINLIFDWPKFA